MTMTDIEIDRHEAAIEAGQLPAYCPFCEDTDYAWVRCEQCGARVCEHCAVSIDATGHLCPVCAQESTCEECGCVGGDHFPSCAFFESIIVDNALVV